MSKHPDPELPRNSRDQSSSHASFEMAYQIRVAIDQIHFAIKSSERCCHDLTPMTEVRMQLLDALQRLETAERHLSQISHKATPTEDRGQNSSALSATRGREEDHGRSRDY